MNYHNRTFRSVSNSSNGEVDSNMLFHYEQAGDILTCTYSGGSIVNGHLIGSVDSEGNIDMRYHQVNMEGVLMTGICSSKPEIMPNGKIRLVESWQWTSGDKSKGRSILEEV